MKTRTHCLRTTVNTLSLNTKIKTGAQSSCGSGISQMWAPTPKGDKNLLFEPIVSRKVYRIGIKIGPRGGASPSAPWIRQCKLSVNRSPSKSHRSFKAIKFFVTKLSHCQYGTPKRTLNGEWPSTAEPVRDGRSKEWPLNWSFTVPNSLTTFFPQVVQ